ncbi:MAG: hypothetical protein JJU13_20455 [Balneolaceae bacterium]|nr:hypothetical protein [Balneolaceae bacterium]
MSKSAIPVTAIFDIGKTNKKIILFDKDYYIVYREQVTIYHIEDDEGFPGEDLETLIDWVYSELSRALNIDKFRVTDLNFSTYGATMVHLNQEGQGEVEPDPALLTHLIANSTPEKKLKLETAHSSGPYPTDQPGEWDINQFSSYKEAYHQLMIDLVCIQHECMKLTDSTDDIDNIIVTGGFGNNSFFLSLLAKRLPGKKIYSASIPHATALGTALIMAGQHENMEGNLKKLLNIVLHKPLKNKAFERHSWE